MLAADLGADSAHIPPRDPSAHVDVPLEDMDVRFGGTRASGRRDSDDADGADGPVVSLENVHKTYLLGVEGVPALRGVSLSVRRGEFLMIIGTSGGGKTSLLNVIGTIDRPTKGNVRVCGLRITARTKDADLAHLRLTRLGFVFQTFNLLPTMTALENVEMPMTLAGVPASERKKRARELLARVGLSARTDHFPSMLSGGEQQRVTIARAVANRPQLVIADEPTGDLSGQARGVVMKLLLELCEREGITVVMVTHDMELAPLADRIVRIRDGKITRVEAIPADERAAARAEIAHGAAEFEDSPEDAREGGAAGGSRSTAAMSGGIITERRKPTDYATHQHHLQRTAELGARRAAMSAAGDDGVAHRKPYVPPPFPMSSRDPEDRARSETSSRPSTGSRATSTANNDAFDREVSEERSPRSSESNERNDREHAQLL